MALPSGTIRGSGLSRSEAAIEAWKKRKAGMSGGGAGDGPTLDPKIAARVKEILASKVKGKKKAKGKKGPDPAKAKAKADRVKEAAAKKAEREKAHAAHLADQAAKKGERDKAKTERVAAHVAKQQEAAKKKQAALQAAHGKAKAKAQAAKEKTGARAKANAARTAKQASSAKERTVAAAAKQQQAQQHKTRVLAEKLKRGEKLSASDQVDAEDAGLIKPAARPPAQAKKAIDMPEYAIKQTAQERAMFASMDDKGTRKTPKDSKAGGGSGGGSASVTEHHGKPTDHSPAGGGPGGRATLKAPISGDMAAHARFVEQKRSAAASRAKQRDADRAGRQKARSNIAKIDAIQKELKKRNTPIARLRELQQQLSDIRSGKAIDMDDIAIKAGARHSKMDASHLDEAARHLHAAGATCPDCAPDDGDDGADAPDADAEKAIKGIMDDPGYYAQHECSDIAQAGSALQTIAMLIGSELSEEDEDDADISQLCDAARILITFIGSELDELEGAAGDAAAGRTAGDVPMAKGIELGTLENGEEVATVSGYAIKAIGDAGMVGGYLVKFGGDGDLSSFRDVFTKSTNYGTHTKSDVWVHHRMLPGLGKKQLTNQAELGMDDEGVFVKHLLDLRSAYEAKLYSMVQDGKLGWSSGTAPHLVERKAMGDGRHEVTQWTLGLDASYTPMPAGGFVVNAGAMKSLFADAGIDLLNAMYIDEEPQAPHGTGDRHDGAKALTDQARRILLELDILQLEETAQ